MHLWRTFIWYSEGSLTNSTNFTLTVTLINHAPSFTLATNFVLIEEETAKLTNVGFATNISRGPSNQSSETYTFTATTVSTNSANATFTTRDSHQRDVDAQPKAHSFGTNTVIVVMTDSGGIATGGIASCTNIFQIGFVPDQPCADHRRRDQPHRAGKRHQRVDCHHQCLGL